MCTKVHGSFAQRFMASCLSTCSSPICMVQFVKRHVLATYWWLFILLCTWDFDNALRYPTRKGHFWGGNDFPAFPFGGICDRSLEDTQIQVGELSQFSNCRMFTLQETNISPQKMAFWGPMIFRTSLSVGYVIIPWRVPHIYTSTCRRSLGWFVRS